jgi:hypothetical protein
LSDLPSTARVPEALEQWIRRFAGLEGKDGDADDLAAGGIRALREALARPGRDREGAYALLAADALLTRAAEAALDDPDPEAALRDLMERVIREEGG